VPYSAASWMVSIPPIVNTPLLDMAAVSGSSDAEIGFTLLGSPHEPPRS